MISDSHHPVNDVQFALLRPVHFVNQLGRQVLEIAFRLFNSEKFCNCAARESGTSDLNKMQLYGQETNPLQLHLHGGHFLHWRNNCWIDKEVFISRFARPGNAFLEFHSLT